MNIHISARLLLMLLLLLAAALVDGYSRVFSNDIFRVTQIMFPKVGSTNTGLLNDFSEGHPSITAKLFDSFELRETVLALETTLDWKAAMHPHLDDPLAPKMSEDVIYARKMRYALDRIKSLTGFAFCLPDDALSIKPGSPRTAKLWPAYRSFFFEVLQDSKDTFGFNLTALFPGLRPILMNIDSEIAFKLMDYIPQCTPISASDGNSAPDAAVLAIDAKRIVLGALSD